MASCNKCGKKKLRKNYAGVYSCRRCGPKNRGREMNTVDKHAAQAAASVGVEGTK